MESQFTKLHGLFICGLCSLFILYGWNRSTSWGVQHVQKIAVSTTEPPDVSDPYEVFVSSAYYYPISESMGNNNVALYFIAPYDWPDKVGNVTVKASSNGETRTSTCKLEISVVDHDRACKMLGIFAGCFGVPKMTKFEISLGNKYHEVPFKTVSYEKKDVVTCVSPLFAAEQWHQIIFAVHVYRHYGSFMHLYVRSVVEPVYELIKIYEKEGYMKAQPFPRLKFSSVPEYMYNPNQHVSFRAQEAAQSDCLLQYKESAQWVMLMDLDDILIPRAGPTYFEEFAAMIHGNEFIHYKKENVYYETSDAPQAFSTFDIFHSARFLNVTEAGKITVQPKYANHTEIHTLEKNREHKGAYPYATENTIVHLKKAHPIGYAGEEKQLWPYFFRNDTTIFNETDTVAIEENYKRLSYKYPEIWSKLPSVGTYFPLISNCYNKKYYKYWYTEPNKVNYCVNPDMCRIPPKLVAPCANAAGDFFSSEEGTVINVHYAEHLRFVIQTQCIP